jgi:hypothetical protein
MDSSTHGYCVPHANKETLIYSVIYTEDDHFIDYLHLDLFENERVPGPRWELEGPIFLTSVGRWSLGNTA